MVKLPLTRQRRQRRHRVVRPKIAVFKGLFHGAGNRSPVTSDVQLVWDREAGGSNPLAPINKINNLGDLRIAFFLATHHSLTTHYFHSPGSSLARIFFAPIFISSLTQFNRLR
jgi:hypothetical protein